MRIHPPLFKYLLGRHILNGYAVAFGVLLVGALASFGLGFEAGMAAASGALCVSIGDNPAPLSARLRILPLAFCCAVTASLATALASGPHPLLEGAVIMTAGAAAGLLIAWGRWAIPISILTLISMVFTLGAPHDKLLYCARFALGGACYVPIALALSRLLDPSGRRIVLAEVLRQFACFLRCVAGFYRKDVDEGAACLLAVEQQAAFSDHLQAARSLSVHSDDQAAATRLIAALAVLLDAFDGVVSTLADHAPLRLAGSPNGLAARIESLLRAIAEDVDELALDLLIAGRPLRFPDHQAALDIFAQDIVRLEAEPGVDPQLLRAARMTRARLSWALAHLGHLPDVISRQDVAAKVLCGTDMRKFAPPLTVGLAPLRAELRWNSPIFRHALRLSLALGCGFALIELVPGLRHGNWILLTIAVIMRASHSATTQRRNERLLGSVIGCGLAGVLLWIDSRMLLLAVQLSAVGIAHSFARVDYRLTSTAATVMALLGLHFIDPGEAAPVAARLIDTLIGAGIAFLFNFLLPHYERHSVPVLARGFLQQLSLYADRVLRWDGPEQDYRLARKSLIESLSSLGESAALMRSESNARHDFWPGYSRLIAAAYVAAAQIVTVRLLIRNRRAELDPAACAALLDETRKAALAELDLTGGETLPDETPHKDEANAFVALRQRCAEVFRETRRLRQIASEDWAA